MKELDVKKLLKELRTKANDEEVKTEVGHIDFKVSAVEKAVMQNNKDLEAVQQLLKKVLLGL
eukprot:CAMPEP_0201283174 /NCGR_PEP_ID=MMETSP1317-20130820/7814_1 /ASSEMBLY_ACC=CAM_ASM_000770 /TAXON_ID=187299 /ORGANISM="Undescribed Undescribed, Strain Undescribed" /LENGTH=61 /DNA_ID=CAMNT_0047598485 /DNA_START=63 /DNA_END=248 /DNA_ORIENTATION=-